MQLRPLTQVLAGVSEAATLATASPCYVPVVFPPALLCASGPPAVACPPTRDAPRSLPPGRPAGTGATRRPSAPPAIIEAAGSPPPFSPPTNARAVALAPSAALLAPPTHPPPRCAPQCATRPAANPPPVGRTPSPPVSRRPHLARTCPLPSVGRTWRAPAPCPCPLPPAACSPRAAALPSTGPCTARCASSAVPDPLVRRSLPFRRPAAQACAPRLHRHCAHPHTPAARLLTGATGSSPPCTRMQNDPAATKPSGTSLQI